MKYESKPEEIEAMQWNGDPETLTALMAWIMLDRLGEQYEATRPSIHFSRRWGPHDHLQGQPTATLEGHRWSFHLEANDWVIKSGPHVFSINDAVFHEKYKQKRTKR